MNHVGDILVTPAPKSCFINLPTNDLSRAKSFYATVGFGNEPQFTDETGACMIWSDSIFVMLLTHKKWAEFDKRPVATADVGEVMIAITVSSRDEVERMVRTATEHGGKADPTPVQEYPFMFSRSFTDPDGHIWEAAWMNPDGMNDA